MSQSKVWTAQGGAGIQQVGTESLQYKKSSEHLSRVFSGLKPDFN